VIEEKADLGIALDGDGDRVLLVDANGRLVDGDDILYVIARARLREKTLRGNVVGTLMTNLGLELALRELGVGLDRTDVGDRYIIERLLQNQWNLGGEPSGHIICLDRTSTGDGIISALQVIAEVAQTGQPLDELVNGVEKCPQILINVSLGDAVARDVMQLETVMAAVRDAEADLGAEGRVLLRPSGTEPLIRVMVEGTRSEQVERLSRQIADVVSASLG
jgi:phosphoglucosamine mutase